MGGQTDGHTDPVLSFQANKMYTEFVDGRTYIYFVWKNIKVFVWISVFQVEQMFCFQTSC